MVMDFEKTKVLTRQVNIRLSINTITDLDKISKKRNTDRSKIVRKIVETELEHMQSKGEL